jgi:hypothetical protein
MLRAALRRIVTLGVSPSVLIGRVVSVRMGARNRIYMLTKFLGRVLALPYVAGMWCTYLLRRILAQYTRERYTLKQQSLRQGFTMATNWLPYRNPSR